jgi:hypothetical protein
MQHACASADCYSTIKDHVQALGNAVKLKSRTSGVPLVRMLLLCDISHEAVALQHTLA